MTVPTGSSIATLRPGDHLLVVLPDAGHTWTAKELDDTRSRIRASIPDSCRVTLFSSDFRLIVIPEEG